MGFLKHEKDALMGLMEINAMLIKPFIVIIIGLIIYIISMTW